MKRNVKQSIEGREWVEVTNYIGESAERVRLRARKLKNAKVFAKMRDGDREPTRFMITSDRGVERFDERGRLMP